MAKKRNRYSGIGGQAVLEGIMMKNKEKYAVAVRRPDGGISVEVDNYEGILHGSKVKEIPFVRGVFNFIESLILGTKCLNYSASFYEEEESDGKQKKGSGNGEKMMSVLVTCFAVVLALGIFVVLPYYLSSLLNGFLRNQSLLAIMEGVMRIVIFILYILAISIMKDIRRLYRYHGAEHKCINCIEHGMDLNVENVRKSSRQHKRCGTSFLLIVMFISILIFMLLQMESKILRFLLRLLLLPVIAGVSYEFIRLAGRSESRFVGLLSKPGLLLQKITTREPDDAMIEVAIASVEAVFDWKAFLEEPDGKKP